MNLPPVCESGDNVADNPAWAAASVGSMSARKQAIAEEVQRAEQMLSALKGEPIDTITISSTDSEEAPFLGLVISKLSPMIGNLLERRITTLLANDDKDDKFGLHWIRQDPGFPDALLVDGDGESTDVGYEVKAWYALSTELTGRFRESVNLLEPRNVRVVIVAWAMSDLVFGTPTILDVVTIDGESMARRRDAHYHRPPDYLCLEPEDTTARTQNLQQTNVNGYKWQGRDPQELQDATSLSAAHSGRQMPSHTEGAQSLARELNSRYAYRLDTNFAKIDRIDHPEIESFKSRVQAMKLRNRPLTSWIKLLKALNNEKKPAEQERAGAVVDRIYSES